MKTTKYKNAIIRFHGEVDYKRVEEAAIIFMKKAQRSKKKHGNKNTSRAV